MMEYEFLNHDEGQGKYANSPLTLVVLGLSFQRYWGAVIDINPVATSKSEFEAFLE